VVVCEIKLVDVSRMYLKLLEMFASQKSRIIPAGWNIDVIMIGRFNTGHT